MSEIFELREKLSLRELEILELKQAKFRMESSCKSILNAREMAIVDKSSEISSLKLQLMRLKQKMNSSREEKMEQGQSKKALIQQFNEYKLKYRKCKNDKQRLETEMTDSTSRIETLQKLLAESESANLKLKNESIKNTMLETGYLKQERQIKHLQNQLKLQTDKSDELCALKKQLQDLKLITKQIHRIEKQNSQLSSQNQLYRDKLNKVRSKLELVNMKNRSDPAEIQQYKFQIEQLSNKVMELESAVKITDMDKENLDPNMGLKSSLINDQRAVNMLVEDVQQKERTLKAVTKKYKSIVSVFEDFKAETAISLTAQEELVTKYKQLQLVLDDIPLIKQQSLRLKTIIEGFAKNMTIDIDLLLNDIDVDTADTQDSAKTIKEISTVLEDIRAAIAEKYAKSVGSECTIS